MSHLKSLTFVPAPPASVKDARYWRRQKLIDRLNEQLELARDPSFIAKIQRMKKGEDGVRRPVEAFRRVKPWWKTDEKGFVVLTVKVGFKTVEFEKGKAGIAVGAKERLEGVLTTLIAATAAGELDGLLEAAGSLSGRSSVKPK